MEGLWFHEGSHEGAGQPRNTQEGPWRHTGGQEGPDQRRNVRRATAPYMGPDPLSASYGGGQEGPGWA